MKTIGGIASAFSRRAMVSRRAILGATALTVAAPALGQECRLGPPAHHKGPTAFLDYDQLELDAAYDQSYYDPLGSQTYARMTSASDLARSRLGEPMRVSYGPTAIEKLDIYRTTVPKASIFVFIHGGSWTGGSAKGYGFPSEMFVHAGAHYVALDFVPVTGVGGDLTVLAEQVRRAIVWVYRNAASFGGDPERLFIGGHSSGGHLCGVALVTDWEKSFGVPATIVKGGLCMSGMYDLAPVRLSWRNSFIGFTDGMVDGLSPQRHLRNLRAPVVVSYGTLETPEFQRQSRDFAAAVRAAGPPVDLVAAANYTHSTNAESLGNPFGPNGRAALGMMNLRPA